MTLGWRRACILYRVQTYGFHDDRALLTISARPRASNYLVLSLEVLQMKSHQFRRTHAVLCFVFIGFALLTSGCEKDVPAEHETEETPQAEVRESENSNLDRLLVAQSEDIPSNPERIVSLAPNITEILFATGAADRVVGVTRFCNFPPRANELPKIGGLIDPDLEMIASLKPDLVLGVTSSQSSELPKALDAIGVEYAFVRMESLVETIDGIELVGQLADTDKSASALARSMREDLEHYEKMPEPGSKPTVLLVLGRDPIVAAGPGTFADDLLTRANGVNAIQGDVSYPKLDVEKVLELDPDRILELTMDVHSEPGIKFWTRHESLHAVQHGNVYRFSDDALIRPGPRLIDGFRKIAMAIKGKHAAH